jgi:hypothetical protein
MTLQVFQNFILVLLEVAVRVEIIPLNYSLLHLIIIKGLLVRLSSSVNKERINLYRETSESVLALMELKGFEASSYYSYSSRSKVIYPLKFIGLL